MFNNTIPARQITVDDVQVGRRIWGKEIVEARKIASLIGFPERYVVTREDGSEQVIHIGTYFPEEALA